ncbi:MAG: monovalent cation/H+ antiporter subunit A [Myxococcota bacterium]
MALALIVLLPLSLFWLPLVGRRFGRHGAAATAGAITLAALAALGVAARAGLTGPVQIVRLDWMPRLGLSLSLRLDGLSFLFCALVLGIGALVVLYARYYLAEDDRRDRFFAFLLLFMGAMLGLVTAENLLALVVLWELTSVSSFLLVAFKHRQPEARRGARRALSVTGLGGLALLGGVLLLGQIVGDYTLTTVLASRDVIVAHPRYPYALALVLLGVFTKSAQVPFHFWLPGAMAAPTPASAYLHSATMVKAGIFLLVRLWPALSGTDLWLWSVGGLGLTTMVFGAVVALFQHDVKGLLAYSTISHLGLIATLFGLNTEMAVVAGLFHIINHACFKASLFMAAGVIDHGTGTRDMRRLGGLARSMRSTAILTTVAAAAMAGLPPLNGFLSKEMFFKEAVEVGASAAQPWLVPAVATLGGAFSVAYSIRLVWDVFYRPATGALDHDALHLPPVGMQAPIALLVAVCIAVGVAPGLVVEPLLLDVARSVLRAQTPEVHLHLWHGFNLPLLMSGIAVAGGVLLARSRHGLSEVGRGLPDLPAGADAFNATLGAMFRFARWFSVTLNRHELVGYVVPVVLSVLVVGTLPFYASSWSGLSGPLPVSPAPAALIAFVALLGLGAVATLRFHRRRILALITLSLSGLGSTLVFVELSAPDLALTQLSVEVATTVLMLLALNFLPAESPREVTLPRVVRDASLALLFGLAMAGGMYAVLTRPFTTIADFYVATSKSHGGGTNIVNVILVDYRGFDTMGEVTVLGVAALAVAAMLHDTRIPRPRASGEGRAWSPDRHPFLLRIMSRPLLPLLLLVAMYILLRGHNLPGGGFIAGLVVGVALILQFLAGGLDFAASRLRFSFVAAIAIGLLVALLTGLGAILFRTPFLTSTFGHVHLGPLEFELASAMAFDLGVFITVVAVLLTILTRLGRVGVEPTERSDA